MNNIFNENGLPFFTQKEIRMRHYLEQIFTLELQDILQASNSAWSFTQIEAPILTPRELINSNYTNADVWAQEKQNYPSEYVLRPETTPGSYAYMVHVLEHQLSKPPFVVWQSGKSFRREQEQPSKHCRFKEFYQQEFQCLFTDDTKNDYQELVLQPMADVFLRELAKETRIVPSDRLPAYSLKTMDIEVYNGDKWMEICSVSLRQDFPAKARFSNKKGEIVEKNCLVLEVAIGLDRCIYNRQIKL
jgi:glycyl-tRNA synthetase